MSGIPTNPTESTRLKNPHLYSGQPQAVIKSDATITNFSAQRSKDEDKLNKLEKAFLAHLRLKNYPWVGIQNITLKLADDCRLTCDFSAIGFNGELILWDVKGFQREDAFLKMKFAARSYTWAKFIIVTREKGQWIERVINP